MRPERDDDMLVSAYAAGDAAAAAALSERHVGRLLALSHRLLGDLQEAEDVAQETMLRLWKMAPKWQPGRARLSTWLYRVATNLCMDRLRRIKETESLDTAAEPICPAPGAPEQILAHQRNLALRDALSAIPERQRLAVVLRYLDGMPTAQVAEIMEIGIEAAESLAARGRSSLAKALADRRHALGFTDPPPDPN